MYSVKPFQVGLAVDDIKGVLELAEVKRIEMLVSMFSCSPILFVLFVD